MKEKIHKAVEVLKNGGVILYPTDTIWGIGCDANNEEAVKRIYNIKKREESKSMIVLVENDRRLQNLVEVPEVAWDLMDFSEKPITIVYDNPKNVAKNLIAEDKSIGIRLVEPMFLKQLIGKLNSALVSTSANVSGRPSPNSFQNIDQEIKDSVDFILDINTDINNPKSSTIIKITKDWQVKVIRE